jgi:hypothetical protein
VISFVDNPVTTTSVHVEADDVLYCNVKLVVSAAVFHATVIALAVITVERNLVTHFNVGLIHSGAVIPTISFCKISSKRSPFVIFASKILSPEYLTQPSNANSSHGSPSTQAVVIAGTGGQPAHGLQLDKGKDESLQLIV